MQKIFIVIGDYTTTMVDKGSYNLVNEFLETTGFIVSVTPQHVNAGGGGEVRGRWLVVADNGKGSNIKL